MRMLIAADGVTDDETDLTVHQSVDFKDLDPQKIVLVTPPYERIAKGYEFVKHITNRSPSLGLLHLAAAVREQGYEPSIIESDLFDLSPDQVVEQILARKPAFVGITLFTVGTWVASEIAKKLKLKRADIKVIIGGPHVSSMGVETIERFPEFDVAVEGEGEEVLIRLLKAFREGGSLAEVPSLIYRDPETLNARVLRTAKLAINKDLDRLPFPAWDLLPDFPSAYLPAVYDFPKGPVASIAASRGCPFHCKFCDTSTFGASVRAYSPERVFEMMQHLSMRWGIKHILFVDDLFTASKKRTTRLCELIIDSGLQMTWSCASRVDVINPQTLKLMKQAGCWEMSFGLESGSNELLQQMDKSASLDKSVQAIHWADEAGIRSKGLFMLGYPGENEDTISQTKAFVRSIPLTIMNLTKFTPYPGSPIYRDIYGTNIRDDHWEKMNGMNFVWTAEGLSPERLDQAYRQILTSFYSQHRVGKNYALLTLKNPSHLRRFLKFVAAMVRAKIRARIRRWQGAEPAPLVSLD
ncbi:MAG: B12-binding domain-containing radical SAM protein [Pseudomonadales bacterium]